MTLDAAFEGIWQAYLSSHPQLAESEDVEAAHRTLRSFFMAGADLALFQAAHVVDETAETFAVMFNPDAVMAMHQELVAIRHRLGGIDLSQVHVHEKPQ